MRYESTDLQASCSMGPNRPVLGRLSVRRGSYYGDESTSPGLTSGWITLRPGLSLEPGVSFNWIDLLQGHFGRHVALARVTYTMTPQAFVGSLIQYNACSDTFSTNVCLRRERAPGSELFLVYAEDRDTDISGRRGAELADRLLLIKVTPLLQL